MAYLYSSNVNPKDRFQRLELQLDSGETIVLLMGRAYDLTASEVARARRFIVLEPTASATVDPVGIAFLPVLGVPDDGQVPIWSENDGAFISGGGTGGSSSWKDPVASKAALPGSGNSNGDTRVVIADESITGTPPTIYVWKAASSTWVLAAGGGSGGGGIPSEPSTITFTANLTGIQVGDPVTWDAFDERFEPGKLVSE